MAELDSVVRDFLIESHENLDGVDNYLLRLEEAQADPASIAAIFRAIHTIKGTCGFLGFGRLEKLAHVGEDLLSRLRDGTLSADPTITDALLALVDAIRTVLARIDATGSEGDEEYASLKARLEELTRGGSASPAALEAPPAVAPSVAAPVEPPHAPVPSAAPPATALPPATPRSGSLGDLLIQRGYCTRAEVEAALAQQAAGDPRRVGEILVGRGSLRSDQLVELLRSQQEARGGALSDSSIRVQVDLLDHLMNLVGELVLTRNQILQFQAESGNAALQVTAQRLNLITTELQEGVMQTRMQPIGTLWDKFPRVVRDVAQVTGKRVNVRMEGRETELDKTIIEAIKDPLMHILRNAVDHGIEHAEVRARQGKDAEGQLRLRAFHEGGQVNIEIRDDGGGIDIERVRTKAVEKGIVAPERAARMTEQEVMQLIFMPGFSTLDTVTQLSGRGVGLDVVKTNIEKIGGTIEIQATAGQGTTIQIRIPLTLAIIPALVVRCAAQRYAIPQASLVELVRVQSDHATGIEYVYGVPVHRLRGDLLPLVFLREALRLGPALLGASGSDPALVNIVVLQEQKQQFGVVVDEVLDTQEIVVKPLGQQLKGLECFAGATIMGDGRVALILDVQGIAHHCGLHSSVSAAPAAARVQVDDAAAPGSERLVIFSVGERDRMALPLARVQRLEEFAPELIEHAGDLPVVQYRGRVLPLVDLCEHFGSAAPSAPGDRTRVIVYGSNEQSVGFVVREIVDIVEETVCLEQCARQVGITGSAVIGGRVTDFLDPEALMALARVAQPPVPAA